MKINILEKITQDIKKEMETIHFLADPHHDHPKIIDICNRPIFLDSKIKDELKIKNKSNENYDIYKDKEYLKLLNPIHNEWLVREVINKWVGKRDTIFFLGDLSLGKRSDAEKFLDRLNGNKFLIEGNHDKNIRNSTRFSQITQIKDFTFSRGGLNIHIVLCHYPLASWNRKIHGSWHLYGHVHGRFKNSGLSMDIGLDNPELLDITGGLYRPLNLYEIVKVMEERREWIEEKEFFNI